MRPLVTKFKSCQWNRQEDAHSNFCMPKSSSSQFWLDVNLAVSAMHSLEAHQAHLHPWSQHNHGVEASFHLAKLHRKQGNSIFLILHGSRAWYQQVWNFGTLSQNSKYLVGGHNTKTAIRDHWKHELCIWVCALSKSSFDSWATFGICLPWGITDGLLKLTILPFLLVSHDPCFTCHCLTWTTSRHCWGWILQHPWGPFSGGRHVTWARVRNNTRINGRWWNLAWRKQHHQYSCMTAVQLCWKLVKWTYARARNSRPLDTDLSVASLKKKMTQKYLSSKLRTKGSQVCRYIS